jgi:hypothetical protein
MAFGVWAPHDPLHASEESDPVFPVLNPMTGANEKGTALSAVTVIVLQASPAAGVHGIAQIVSLHLAPVTGPGSQTLGI